jgi:hypothetical protein
MKKLIIVLAMLSTPAMAEWKDGNQLFNELSDHDPTFIAPMAALGYVQGVADVYQKSQLCIPNNVQAKQAADVVRNYLYANPQLRQYAADSLVLAALKAAWPCRNGKTL